MNAITKIFNEKDFLKNFNKTQPNCLIMGEEAFNMLRKQYLDKDLSIDSALYETGYVGKFTGTKIYVIPESYFPSNEIIFGVE